MTKKLFSVIFSVLMLLALAFSLCSCNPDKFTEAGKSMVSDAEDYVINQIKNPISTTQPTTAAPTTVAQTSAEEE